MNNQDLKVDCPHPVEDFCVSGSNFVCAKCGEVLDIQAPENSIEDMLAGEIGLDDGSGTKGESP